MDGRFRRPTAAERFARQAALVPGGVTGDLVRDALAARHEPPEPAPAPEPPMPEPRRPLIPAGPMGGAPSGGDLIRQAVRGPSRRHNPLL
jgi:hypothetical protein